MTTHKARLGRLKLMSVGAWPLTYKFIIIFLVIALVPMAILSYLTMQNGLKQVEEDQKQHLTLKANTLAFQIDQILQQHQKFAISLSKDKDVINFFLQPESASFKRRVDDDLLLLSQSLPNLSHVSLLNLKGEFIATARPELMGFNASFRNYFKQAKQGKHYISTLLMGKQTSENGIFFSSPVFDDQQQVIGIVLIKIKGEGIENIFRKNQLQDYQLTAFLVDETSVITYHTQQQWRYHSLLQLSEERIKHIQENSTFPVKTILPLAQSGLENTLLYTSSQSEKFYLQQEAYIAGIAPVLNNRWHIYVTKPYTEFSLPIQHLFYHNLFILLMCTIGSILIAWLLSRTLIRPLKVLIQNTQLIQAGDFHLLNKNQDLDAVAKRQDEIGAFANVFKNMAQEVYQREFQLDILVQQRTQELSEKNQLLAQSYARIDHELQLAHDMQQAILPQDFPQQEQFEIKASMRPAREMGGDFYECFPVNDNGYGVLVADVSGKGIASAFFMGISSTIIKHAASIHHEPHDVLTFANQLLCKRNPSELFVTLFYGIFYPNSGKFIYANAGHHPPLLRRQEGTVEILKSAYELPLGAWEDVQYTAFETQLDANDVLLIFSDGITEALSETNEEFGEQRLYDWLHLQNPTQNVDQYFEELKNTVQQFVGKAEPHDDITILFLKNLQNKMTDHKTENTSFNEYLVDQTWYLSPAIEHIEKISADIEQALLPLSSQYPELAFQVNLCVDEILNNIIHYSEHPREKNIEIKLQCNDELLICKICDEGIPFNPFVEAHTANIHENLEQREIGGLGVHLVKNLMDQYTYTRQDSKNVISLYKYLNSKNGIKNEP